MLCTSTTTSYSSAKPHSRMGKTTMCNAHEQFIAHGWHFDEVGGVSLKTAGLHPSLPLGTIDKDSRKTSKVSMQEFPPSIMSREIHGVAEFLVSSASVSIGSSLEVERESAKMVPVLDGPGC